MSVPKKRKKLDQNPAKPVRLRSSEKQTVEKKPPARRKTPPSESIEKIDQAFEIIDTMDTQAVTEAAAPGPVEAASHKRSGFRVSFSCDALMPQSGSGKSPIVNFDFTIPFIWDIPIIGGMALKAMEKIKPLRKAESIKDILKTLKP